MSAPLGAQPAPEVTDWHPPNAGGGISQAVSAIELRFATPEMASAYLAWLRSGAAHEAFGTWADSQGLESWS